MSQAHETIAEVAGTGRPSSYAGAGGESPVARPDEVQLREMMDRYDGLGDEPPEFNLATNDADHAGAGAHTIDRHGPDIPLRRDPATKTVEGRVYGDTGWARPENWSYRWTDSSTMNRTIRDHVGDNWEAIRGDLAMFGSHESRFDAGHRVGEGYYNRGMFGAGDREARYAATSYVRIRIELVPGSDPPQPFIVTAFPAGLL